MLCFCRSLLGGRTENLYNFSIICVCQQQLTQQRQSVDGFHGIHFSSDLTKTHTTIFLQQPKVDTYRTCVDGSRQKAGRQKFCVQ